MSRLRMAGLALLVLLGGTACRDSAGSGGAPEPVAPGPGVQRQVDDLESTMDRIESELNAG